MESVQSRIFALVGLGLVLLVIGSVFLATTIGGNVSGSYVLNTLLGILLGSGGVAIVLCAGCRQLRTRVERRDGGGARGQAGTHARWDEVSLPTYSQCQLPGVSYGLSDSPPKYDEVIASSRSGS